MTERDEDELDKHRGRKTMKVNSTVRGPHPQKFMAEQPHSPLTIAVTLLLYCISGTLLTLVNKLAILAFPFPNLLLVGQNGATIVLLIIGSLFFPAFFLAMPRIDLTIIKVWSPLVLLFVFMLLSSLNALSFVSAVTLIVMRNLSTLCVAFFERIWLGEEVKSLTWFALFGIFVGSVLFGARDMTFSVHGYLWLAVNVLSTSTYQVYVKKLIKESKDLGPFGMSYINNMLSLPMFIVIALQQGELPRHAFEFTQVSFETQALLLLSAFLGFSLSTSAFMVNKMITATSMMVANNVNKFAVIILSEMFVERTLDDVSTFGTVLVMFFGWFYSKTKTMNHPIVLPGWLNQALKHIVGNKSSIVSDSATGKPDMGLDEESSGLNTKETPSEKN